MGYGSSVSPLLSGFNQGVQGMTTLLGAPGRQRLVDAQTAYMQQRASGTGAGLPPGLAGQWAQLDHYRNVYGINSVQYQELSKALDSQMHYLQQRGNYAQKMAALAGLRIAPTQQKTQTYASLVSMGYPVTDINNMSDQQRANIVQHNIPYAQFIHQSQGASIAQGAVPVTPTGISPAVSQPQPQLPPQPTHPQGAPGLSPSLQGFQQQTPGIQPQGRTIEGMAEPQPQAQPQAAVPPPPQTAEQMFDASGAEQPQLKALAGQEANADRIKQLAQLQSDQIKSGLFKSTTTTDQQNRLVAGGRAVTLVDNMSKDAPLALQYAGLAGKSKLVAAKLRQSNSPMYQAYKRYKLNQAALSGDLALALGIHATDKAFKTFAPMLNIDRWDTSPQTAVGLFNTLSTTLHQENQRNAQTLNQTRQQVRAAPVQIGGAGQAPSAPTFQNRQQFLSWYQGLPPAQQHAYYASHGGK